MWARGMVRHLQAWSNWPVPGHLQPPVRPILLAARTEDRVPVLVGRAGPQDTVTRICLSVWTRASFLARSNVFLPEYAPSAFAFAEKSADPIGPLAVSAAVIHSTAAQAVPLADPVRLSPRATP